MLVKSVLVLVASLAAVKSFQFPSGVGDGVDTIRVDENNEEYAARLGPLNTTTIPSNNLCARANLTPRDQSGVSET